MDDLPTFDLLLFDFDGLLVNSEHLHYEAYRRMFANRGYKMAWSFPRYCMAAHYESTGLREAAYDTIPGLHNTEPDWSVLYDEKKRAYRDLIQEGQVQLMPGVDKLLKQVAQSSATSCVVTNSPPDVVKEIRDQIPELLAIEHWITREQYDRPKPAPDGYLHAIDRFAKPGDRIVGFEDTIRGARSLLDAYDQTPRGLDQEISKEVVLVSELELVGFDKLAKSYPFSMRHLKSFM